MKGPTVKQEQQATPASDQRPKYFSKGDTVRLGDQLICKAKSTTYARRIAGALNVYTPDRRGQ